jgi:2-keto-3-deoxy-L-rhamnonate aldolase RhmA
MPVRPNRMKQKLREGLPVFGGLIRTPEPTLVEVLGYAGYDNVVLAAEHGAHSFEALDTLILTAYASAITPIVRVNENTPGLIGASSTLAPKASLCPILRPRTTRVVPSQLPYPPRRGTRHRPEPWLPVWSDSWRRTLQTNQ